MISLSSSHGGDITTQELIDCHCLPGTRTSGKNIPIKVVVDLPLYTLIFTLQRLAGSQVPHQDSRENMLYAIEDMAPTFFIWAKALLPIFKY